MTRQPLLVAATLFAFAAAQMPNLALAYGHGQSPELAHYVQAPRPVYAAVVARADLPSRYLARYDIAGGLSVVVTLKPVARASARASHLQLPGQLIAGFEGHDSLPEASLLAQAGAKVLLTAEALRIVAVDTRGFAQLSARPHAFVDAVPAANERERPMGLVLSSASQASKKKGALAPRMEAFVTLEPDANKLLATVRELSGEDTIDGNVRIVNRGNDAPRALAQKYMVERFRSLGLEANTKCYSQSRYSGCNVEATLWGADRNEVVVFSAHLDSVRNKGADDDGSGSAALLEVARLYAELSPKKSIRFLAFDQEELGLVGSKAYAGALGPQPGSPRIAGVFQMDMIGYDADGDSAIHAMDCDRSDSKPLTGALTEANTRLGLRFKIVKACTNRSDHASFWNQGVPATLVSENFFGGDSTRSDSNRCYHQACDTVGLLNVPYMTRIVKLVANAGWAFQESLR